MAKVLPELRNTNNGSRSLRLECNKYDGPAGVHAPNKGPWISPQSLPYRPFMVFEVSCMRSDMLGVTEIIVDVLDTRLGGVLFEGHG